MKIQCVLHREGGTKADLDGVEYHFEPLPDGAHVAEIENETHIDRFLSIPEAYKVYHGKNSPKGTPRAIAAAIGIATQEPVSAVSVMLEGSSEHPAQFDIGGKTYSQKEIVERAFAASGLTSDEWNELGDDERAAKMDIALDEIADGAEVDESNGPDNDERAALAAQYEAKFGKKPHYRLSIEKIRAELEA